LSPYLDFHDPLAVNLRRDCCINSRIYTVHPQPVTMADQLNLRDGSAPPTYFPPFKRNDFRLDEGYSEETRSQAGSELPAESRQEQIMDMEGETAALLLPDWVGNLNEEQRSGMLCAAITCKAS
jgi:hypothetical protein